MAYSVTKARLFKYDEDLYPGAVLGEETLGGIAKRLQNIVAITHCDFMIIDAASYRAINDISGTKQLSVNEKFEFLQMLPVFKHFERYDLFKLAQALAVEQVPKHTRVLSKGQEAESLCLIFNGKVDVLSDIDDKSPLATLQKYDYFAESSLLRYLVSKSRAKDHHGRHDKGGRDHHDLGKPGRYHYLECFDAIAASSLELLVIHKNSYHIIDAIAAKQIRLAYIARMNWRADRADIVYEEYRELSRSMTKLLRQNTSGPTRPTTATGSVSSMQHNSISESIEISSRDKTSSSTKLPLINKVNPITLLATSKNAIALRNNKLFLDKMANAELIKRPQTAAVSNGFSVLMGSAKKTPFCEFAMNLKVSSSFDRISTRFLLADETTTPARIASPSSPVHQSSGTSKPTPEILESSAEKSHSAADRILFMGSQRIPSITSYCEIYKF